MWKGAGGGTFTRSSGTKLAVYIVAVGPPQGRVCTALAQVSCCCQGKMLMMLTGWGAMVPQKAECRPGICNEASCLCPSRRRLLSATRSLAGSGGAYRLPPRRPDWASSRSEASASRLCWRVREALRDGGRRARRSPPRERSWSARRRPPSSW